MGSVRRRVAVTVALGLVIVLTGAAPASAALPDTTAIADATGTGLHNSYEPERHDFLVDALDAVTAGGDGGPHIIEIDVWTNARGWRVHHDFSLSGRNDNNCERATTPAELRTTARNQDLGSCLDNLRAWHELRPGHGLIVVKLELKSGFAASSGYGPAQLDRLIRDRLGDALLYRPADVVDAAPDLAAGARAGGWDALAATRGRFLFLVQTGTFEAGNPLDTLHTDVEYAAHLRADPAAAMLFPVTRREGASGDPRDPYPADLRPWFVVVDTDAVGLAGLPQATRDLYRSERLFVVATDAHAVAPALDREAPAPEAARERVALLACLQASVVSADWTIAGWHDNVARGAC